VITAAFVRRPPLVFVLLALMALAGTLAYRSLVQQQFPNVSVPTISVSVLYSGASPTVMRDTIVRPIEDAIAGTPDLQTLSSNIQNGRATISAAFYITSDVNTDLVNVQKSLQTAQHQLPTTLQPPTVSVRDPSQATVVTLSMTSSKLTEGQLSSSPIARSFRPSRRSRTSPTSQSAAMQTQLTRSSSIRRNSQQRISRSTI